MKVDSNFTQLALTIFIQETVSEGVFWIGTGNVTGDYYSPVLIVNYTMFLYDQKYSEWDYYPSIYEFNDKSVPKTTNFDVVNYDACGAIDEIFDTSLNKTKYSCLIGYSRTYAIAEYNCKINGMKLMQISDYGMIFVLGSITDSYLGESSGAKIWINGNYGNGSCSYFDGTSANYEVGTSPCDSRYWSYCEAPVGDF